MSTPVSRKSFLASLGAAGIGAGLLRFAPPVAAQDTDDDSRDAPEGGLADGTREDAHVELYAAFTEALAAELGDTTADEVDAAIRKAIMSLIDTHVSEAGLTSGQAEALKVIVATTDTPILPGFMGMGPGMHAGFGHGMHHGHGKGTGRGRVRVRSRRGDGRKRDKRRDTPMAPDAPLAPGATPPMSPDAPATPEAGA
jgi:hypothetical protein